MVPPSAAFTRAKNRPRKPRSGAVVSILVNRARRQAAAAGQPGPSRPFAGVPILLKDAGQERAGTPHGPAAGCYATPQVSRR